MATLVILGGGLTQCDAIASALKLGHTVVVFDGNPLAPGLLLEGVLAVPQSFADVDAAERALARQNIDVDAVLPYGSDLSVKPAADLSARLGLGGISPQVARACTDKTLMRRLWRERGVATLPYHEAKDRHLGAMAAKKIGLPVVVKPPDNAAQRGVQLVTKAEALDQACQEALDNSPSGRLLVEKYVDGPELAVTTFASGGKTVAIQVTDRVTGPPPYLGICLAHVYPSELDAATVQKVERTVERAACALGVEEGPTYSQVRVGNDGTVYVLETGARLGGGRDCELRSALCSQDAIAAHIDVLLGRSIDPSRVLDPSGLRGGGCVLFLTAKGSGTIREIRGAEEVLDQPGVVSAGFFFAPGDHVPALCNGAARLGYILTTGDHRQEALDLAKEAAKRMTFVL